jgi:hypothetical protein
MTDTDSESGFEEVHEDNEAIDVDGTKMRDKRGRGLVKVCEVQDTIDADVKREMDELQNVFTSTVTPPASKDSTLRRVRSNSSTHRQVKPSTASTIAKSNPPSSFTMSACPTCSLLNERSVTTCVVCANVLQPDMVPGCWRCNHEGCKDNNYMNAGDASVCGVCGKRKGS